MDDKKADFLVAAYNAHKAELASRRRTEIIVVALSALVYSAFIAFIIFNADARQALQSPFAKAVSTIVLVLIANIVCYNLHKNYRRHCELQEIIARIDRAFGFFDESVFIPERALYPDDWKSAGQVREMSIYSRFLIIALFALMSILTVWVIGF